MKLHPFAHIVAAVVGLLLSGSAAGAQAVATPSVKIDPPEAAAPHSRPGSTGGREPPLIRRAVPLPSPDFTTYIEGELVRVSVPSNWRELPGSNAVTFAPEGAYGNVGVKSVFTHGVGMGLARNDKQNLQSTTDDFIASYVLTSPNAGRAFQYRTVTIGNRRGLHTTLSRVSEATGELERIEMFTTLLRDGALFYVQAVAPRPRAPDYASTFRRIVESIAITDCDRHAMADNSIFALTIPVCQDSTRSVTR